MTPVPTPPESTWPMWIDWITSPTMLASIAVAAFGIAWLRHLDLHDNDKRGD